MGGTHGLQEVLMFWVLNGPALLFIQSGRGCTRSPPACRVRGSSLIHLFFKNLYWVVSHLLDLGESGQLGFWGEMGKQL